MALNLKTLATRSLTALFFVAVLLGSLLFSYTSFCFFFFLVALIGVHEFCKLAEKLGVLCDKKWLFAFTILIYLNSINWLFFRDLAKVPYLPEPSFLIVMSAFFFLVQALFSKDADPLKQAVYHSFALIYAVLPICFLHKLVFTAYSGTNYEPRLLLGIILLIWSNDTFAYLGGSLFGKRKLIERISPGKTIEGTLIGIVITFLLSFLLESILSFRAPIPWYSLGLIVPVTATLGDLLESLMKRQAGIKDTGSLLPGHGGVLDRFDSLLLVSPVVVFILKFL